MNSLVFPGEDRQVDGQATPKWLKLKRVKQLRAFVIHFHPFAPLADSR